MTVKNAPELEIDEMNVTSSLPAKPDELADIEPILAEVRNQQTGEFEKVMISPHDIRKYICPTATLQELYIFMSICRHQGIDPISEAYFVKFGDLPGFTVMKYTVYLKRALQSGVLKSIRHEFDDEENPTKIMVYIQRNDMEGEWCWTTYRKSVEKRRKSDNKVTEIWDTQLHFMMCKCGYSQALRFFCADVVGALPPTQEEMPGIGALNMQSPLTGISTGMLTEGTEVPGEVLEVESVDPLPEHLDMAPLRIAFHEMSTGMFTDDDARHTWQMKHTGVASMKKWGTKEYAKAYKRLSQEAGPPNGLDLDRIKAEEAAIKEASEDTAKTGEGTPVEEVVNKTEYLDEKGGKYLATVRQKYVAHVNGRFETPEHQEKWQRANLGMGDIDKWFAIDFLKAIALLDQADLEIKKNTAAGIELKNQYVELIAFVFKNVENQIRWQKDITGEGNFAEWDPDQFRTAIQELIAFKKLEPIAQQHVNLRLLYEECIEGKFATVADQEEWQLTVSQKTADREKWGIVHYNMALNELDKLDGLENKTPIVLNEFLAVGADLEMYLKPDVVVAAKVAELTDTEITIEFDQQGSKKHAVFSLTEVQEWLTEGKWKLIQVDDVSADSTTTQDVTEDDEEPVMTTAQFKKLKEITAGLPIYHRNLGSMQFRDRCQEITGRRPRSIRKYTEIETSDLIHQLEDEREEYLRKEEEKDQQRFDLGNRQDTSE